MRVIVAGVDYPPRPHFCSQIARAYRRLGLEVIVVGASYDQPIGDGDTFVDPCFEPPAFRFGTRPVPLKMIVDEVGGADFCVMVDQSDPWTIVNDGSVPFAYVWREGNPEEATRVLPAAGDAPIFCCMVNKGSQWTPNTRFMPFGVDSMFCDGPDAVRPFSERPYDLIYTGRERVSSVTAKLRQAFGDKLLMPGYISGYEKYRELLSMSRCTHTFDGNRYVGSRGLEAMAVGCVGLWDGGDAWRGLGLSFGVNCLRFESRHDAAEHEFVPANVDEFIDLVRSISNDEARWTKMSRAGQIEIETRHTYESRALEIVSACGIVSMPPEQATAAVNAQVTAEKVS